MKKCVDECVTKPDDEVNVAGVVDGALEAGDFALSANFTPDSDVLFYGFTTSQDIRRLYRVLVRGVVLPTSVGTCRLELFVCLRHHFMYFVNNVGIDSSYMDWLIFFAGNGSNVYPGFAVSGNTFRNLLKCNYFRVLFHKTLFMCSDGFGS